MLCQKIEGITEAQLNDPTNMEAKSWVRMQVMKDEAKFTWTSQHVKKENIKKTVRKRTDGSLK